MSRHAVTCSTRTPRSGRWSGLKRSARQLAMLRVPGERSERGLLLGGHDQEHEGKAGCRRPAPMVAGGPGATGGNRAAAQAGHVAAVHGLPPIHKDPFDRVLIAQAVAEKLTLVTSDGEVARMRRRGCGWLGEKHVRLSASGYGAFQFPAVAPVRGVQRSGSGSLATGR